MRLSSGFMEIDVHGMTKAQAISLIDARLKQAGSAVYRIRVIHGYHNGTELRDEVRRRYRRHPKVKRIELGLNEGQTELVLRELI